MNGRTGFAIGVISCVTLFAGVSAYLSASNDISTIHSDSSASTLSVPLCETEDQNGCFWDAEHAGNGEGTSYFADEDGTVYYPAEDNTLNGVVTSAIEPVEDTPAYEAPIPEVEPSEAPVETAQIPIPTYDDHVASFQEDGFLIGEVIICPPGLSVGIDTYDDGTSWAACM